MKRLWEASYGPSCRMLKKISRSVPSAVKVTDSQGVPVCRSIICFSRLRSMRIHFLRYLGQEDGAGGQSPPPATSLGSLPALDLLPPWPPRVGFSSPKRWRVPSLPLPLPLLSLTR